MDVEKLILSDLMEFLKRHRRSQFRCGLGVRLRWELLLGKNKKLPFQYHILRLGNEDLWIEGGSIHFGGSREMVPLADPNYEQKVLRILAKRRQDFWFPDSHDGCCVSFPHKEENNEANIRNHSR